MIKYESSDYMAQYGKIDELSLNAQQRVFRSVLGVRVHAVVRVRGANHMI